MENIPINAMGRYVPNSDEILGELRRPSRKRFAMALALAAASDVASICTEFAPPVQWTVDLVTASLLFLILGRRWAILPGLMP